MKYNFKWLQEKKRVPRKEYMHQYYLKVLKPKRAEEREKRKAQKVAEMRGEE